MDQVVENIIDNLNTWTERIVDVEERLKKSRDIQESVLDSLHRQVLDSLASFLSVLDGEYPICLCEILSFSINFAIGWTRDRIRITTLLVV